MAAEGGKPSAAEAVGGVRVAPERPAGDPLDGERKTVTALIADIKGSTELEQDFDPEDARVIVDPALKLMIDAVDRYDGYIVQSTGDGIFSLFGAPAAHEDHPLRALYAALRQAGLVRYGAVQSLLDPKPGSDFPFDKAAAVGGTVRRIETGNSGLTVFDSQRA